MILALVFLVVSILAAVLFVYLSGAALWQGLLFFLGLFLLIHVCYILFLYLASLSVDRTKPLPKQNRICRLGAGGVIGLLCTYTGLRIRISGEDKLPQQNFLLVCNHRSAYDPLIIMDRLRRYNISFVSKTENLRLPLLGSIAYGAGFLAIDRENNRKALKTILQAADYIKRGICSMAIYPEGTRNMGEGLLPFHPGSFKIAQKADCPLVISAIRGTENIKKRGFLKPTAVYLDILETLPADKVKAMSTQELAEYSKTLIEADLEGKG